MTLEELMQLKLSDVLTEEPGGLQVLRDTREGKLRVLLFATGDDAAWLLRFLETISLMEKELPQC
jgi:hypothetical protein